MKRGQCPLATKALLAQRAGALGVVIADNGKCTALDQYCVPGADRSRGEAWARLDLQRPWAGVHIPVVLVLADSAAAHVFLMGWTRRWPIHGLFLMERRGRAAYLGHSLLKASAPGVALMTPRSCREARLGGGGAAIRSFYAPRRLPRPAVDGRPPKRGTDLDLVPLGHDPSWRQAAAMPWRTMAPKRLRLSPRTRTTSRFSSAAPGDEAAVPRGLGLRPSPSPRFVSCSGRPRAPRLVRNPTGEHASRHDRGG